MDQVTTEELRIMKPLTSMATLREGMYTAECVQGEIRFLYTELWSTGKRAYKVVIRRGVTQDYSFAMVFTGTPDDLFFKWEEAGVVRGPSQWFEEVKAHSLYAAPSAVQLLAYSMYVEAVDLRRW